MRAALGYRLSAISSRESSGVPPASRLLPLVAVATFPNAHPGAECAAPATLRSNHSDSVSRRTPPAAGEVVGVVEVAPGSTRRPVRAAATSAVKSAHVAKVVKVLKVLNI